MYRIKPDDYERVITMYKASYANYSKLARAFPNKEIRQDAIEAVLRHYLPYDMYYGEGLALDSDLNEAAFFMTSEQADYTEERMKRAGCFNADFRRIMNRMTEQQQKTWQDFFDELDRLERDLYFADRYFYVDFLGVAPRLQGQGRGSRLLSYICDMAEKESLPIILFTNGERDVRFYEKNGFRQAAVTRSEKFGFENVYMMK